jgi:hypothetical protein
MISMMITHQVPQIPQEPVLMIKNMSKQPKLANFFRVYMRCVTWSRDSHGLFDYESRYISKKNIKSTTSGRIIRLNNDVEFIDMDLRPENIDETAKPLITVTQHANGKLLTRKKLTH